MTTKKSPADSGRVAAESEIATPIARLEPLTAGAPDPLEGAAECARIAMVGVAADLSSDSELFQNEIAAVLTPFEAEPMSLDALFVLLVGTGWPLPLRVTLGRAKTPDLVGIGPPAGVAVVAALAPLPADGRAAQAVALVHSHPAHIYDPLKGGNRRVPTPRDQISWFRGSRQVLVVEYEDQRGK